MREIVVPGVGVRIPVIGFGCSSLASVSRKTALELLGTAFDAGARHFDVARYYGYGEAEGLLGEFLRARRAEVTITTKFGIEPPRRSSAVRIAMGAGRRLVRLLPDLRGTLQRRAQALVKTGGFSVKKARASLETSLRELRTDYIDFFLLHEYEPLDDSPDELVAFLADRVKAGVIRYFGLGTGIEHVVHAMQRNPALCHIVQFENSVVCQNIDRLPSTIAQPLLVVTHGSLGASYRSVVSFLQTRLAVSKAWSNQLRVDCSQEETVSDLMLNYAVHVNPKGLVLFSSRNVSRARRNIRAVLDSRISSAQAELFGQLVERDLIPTMQTI
jgi:D-threo-aldose 1-dehydrogenase